MRSLRYVYKFIISGYVTFQEVAPRKPIYFRRQSPANSIQIRHVFCFTAYSRAQSPDILNRAQWLILYNEHVYVMRRAR